jgi:hypothetical protein
LPANGRGGSPANIASLIGFRDQAQSYTNYNSGKVSFLELSGRKVSADKWLKKT